MRFPNVVASVVAVPVLSIVLVANASAQIHEYLTPLQRAAMERRAVVAEIDGQRGPVAGRLVRVDDTFVVINVAGVDKRVDITAVAKIDRVGDPLKNGTFIGALALGAWCAFVCGQGLSSIEAYPPAVGFAAGVGGLIGAAVDASKTGTSPIYRRQGPRVTAAFTGRSLLAVVRF